MVINFDVIQPDSGDARYDGYDKKQFHKYAYMEATIEGNHDWTNAQIDFIFESPMGFRYRLKHILITKFEKVGDEWEIEIKKGN